MKNTVRCVVCVLVAAAIAGCGEKNEEKKPVEKEKPEVQATSFSFTATNETIAAKDIVVREDTKVEADFNLDGLMDIATISGLDADKAEVAIYIRKAKDPTQSQEEPTQKRRGLSEAEYYKAGFIRRAVAGKVVGFASRQIGRNTDLVILVDHTNRTTEMICYSNDGKTFAEE